MFVVLGATGHIGSALAGLLLERGESVHVVLHREQQAPEWRARGATCSVADVHDTAALRDALAHGQRAFLLNPPGSPSADMEAEERESIRSIVAATRGLVLDRIVLQSTYGAQQGLRIGDLGTLHEFETALAAQPTPTRVIRAAYYMSNWDHALESARNEGVVHTFYPLDFALPMVAPLDIAKLALELLSSVPAQNQLHWIEGPARYTALDVARAFSEALGKPVRAVSTPHSAWPAALRALGFSEASAASFIGMTELTLSAEFPNVDQVRRGSTSLDVYISELVARQRQRSSAHSK